MENHTDEIEKENTKKPNEIRRLLIAFIVVITVACLSIFGYNCYKFYDEQTASSRQLVSTLNLQLQKGVDNYLRKLEDTGKILFSHNDYIEYNAAASKGDKYVSLQLENEMSDFLVSLSTMDNYSDFGIVYSNNHTVGRINDGTIDLYGTDLYKSLCSSLGDRKTCWTTGYNGNYKRLYYLRRVNDNAVLAASIYTDELTGVFVANVQLENVKVMLTDNSKHIIYSSSASITGVLDDEYSKDWTDEAGFTVVDTRYIESVNTCGSDWHIVSVLDLNEQILMYKKIGVVSFAILMAGILIIISFVFLAVAGQKEPEKSPYFSKMETVDGLTGLCNAETAENLIAEKIETCITGSTIMLALVCIKNFDLIEENYGITGKNEALLTVSALLKDFYGEKNIVGKTGENEFEVFADFTEYDLFKAHDKLKNSLKALDERLSECQLSSGRGYIKCCVGAAVYPDSSSDYDELYECAKTSLQKSVADREGKFVLHTAHKQEKRGQKV